MSDILSKIQIYGITKSFILFIFEVRLLFRRLFFGSYSQNGEDYEIEFLLNNKKNGFYIDVGAINPIRFNNTKRFYQKGWTGINIEPNPKKIPLFLKERKRDINLNIGISEKEGILEFYEFFPDTLSTFSIKISRRNQSRGFILKKIEKVPVGDLGESYLIVFRSVRRITEAVVTELFGTRASSGWPRCGCMEFFAWIPPLGNLNSLFHFTKFRVGRVTTVSLGIMAPSCLSPETIVIPTQKDGLDLSATKRQPEKCLRLSNSSPIPQIRMVWRYTRGHSSAATPVFILAGRTAIVRRLVGFSRSTSFDLCAFLSCSPRNLFE